MISHALVQTHADMRPLQVLGTEVRFLCRATDTDSRFSMMEVMLPLGAGPPPHHHDWDEAYYIADGEVLFQLGSQAHRVAAGDFVYAPAGTVHAFQGLAETPSRVLILDAPAHAAGFFIEVDREVRQMPDDAAKVPAIGLRHGVIFLPPQEVQP
ncbi:cupin domain-containing protein [Ideonella sp.]|uniref:cupin domain-containing protein n=1 Tax=Ideonella sp. TaxID=1929293 RepID=UPI003BB68EA7